MKEITLYREDFREHQDLSIQVFDDILIRLGLELRGNNIFEIEGIAIKVKSFTTI